MNNTKIYSVWLPVVVAALMVGAGAYVYLSGNGMMGNSDQGGLYGSSDSGSNTSVRGQAVFSVTDAAANIQNVSEIKLTVDKVEAQSATQGWVTVSNTPKQYNLLALNASGKAEILANASLAAGKYNQVRLHVSDVTVVEKSGASKPAKLPSGELKIAGGFTVEANSTASVMFDFKGDKSLHVTGQAQYIFAPVVNVETKDSAQVAVDASGTVSVSGGRVETNTNVGMDIDGSVKANFILDANANLELITGGLIKVKTAGVSETSVSITADKAAKIATDGDYLDTAISVNLTMSGGVKTWRVSGLKNLLPTSVTIDATTGAVVSAQ